MELRQKKVEGMVVRSHAKWLYEGEQNSKYFCNPEKKTFCAESHVLYSKR